MVSSTWARSPRKADNAVGVAAFSTCWYPVSSAAGWSSLVARRAHNPKVAGSNPAPATKYRRFSRLVAYAQAADQHVWSAASVFLGTVCGDLLSPCICSLRRVARAQAPLTLRFRDRGAGRPKRCMGMHGARVCSCSTQRPARLVATLLKVRGADVPALRPDVAASSARRSSGERTRGGPQAQPAAS